MFGSLPQPDDVVVGASLLAKLLIVGLWLVCVLRYRVCWAFCFAPYARASFGIAPKEAKRSSPNIRPSASLRVPSLHRCSGGRQNGPSLARLCLSRHPCRSTPYTTTPLGLLTGRGRSRARSKARSKARSRSTAPLPSPLPQAGEGTDWRMAYVLRHPSLLRERGLIGARPQPYVTPLPLAGEGLGERGF